MDEEIKFTEKESQLIQSALMAIGSILVTKLNNKCKKAEIGGKINIEDINQVIEFKISAK